MAWSQVKQFAKKNNTTFTIPGLQALVHDTFVEVTPTRWSDLIEHTQKKVEDHYFDADGLVRWQKAPEFVIRTDEDSSDESDDDSDSEGSSDGLSDEDQWGNSPLLEQQRACE